MTQISRKRLPEKHDFIIGTVVKITKHGVYVRLKEYENAEGYIHVSEVTGTWVRNIRNFVRQDEQVVARVLRINDKTGQIDLSLKRVSAKLKKAKIAEYKKQNSALTLLKLISDKVGKTVEELRDLMEDEFILEYGSLYNGLEELAFSGLHALDSIEIDPKLANDIHQIAEMSIQVSTVVLSADLAVRSFASDGVEQVKSLLKIADKIGKQDSEITCKITTIGSPQYRITMEGRSYPELNDLYMKIESGLKEQSTKLDVEYVIEQHK